MTPRRFSAISAIRMDPRLLEARGQMEGGTELGHCTGEARALSGWRIKRFESSVSDCRNYYDLYATIGAYYKAEERAGRVTRKYFVSIFS